VGTYGVVMREPLVVEFHEDRRDAVVDRMADMASKQGGWLNLTPGLDMDVPPLDRGPLTALLGSRGPTVPLATWTPPQGRDPATAGIEHPEGPQAVRLLAERGTPVPAGWRVLQDHAKRGLVVAVVGGQDRDDLDRALVWLVVATGSLCPWPRTGEWRALCYMP
jgi:hypothetical protein